MLGSARPVWAVPSSAAVTSRAARVRLNGTTCGDMETPPVPGQGAVVAEGARQLGCPFATLIPVWGPNGHAGSRFSATTKASRAAHAARLAVLLERRYGLPGLPATCWPLRYSCTRPRTSL